MADGSVRTGNHNENHHMVNFSEDLYDIGSYSNGMISCAGSIQQNHTADKNKHGNDGKRSEFRCFH